jgi:alpha-L-arabinofuranosidase
MVVGSVYVVSGQSVVANINASKSGAPISKYVYGQFVEHIGGIINSGMWAELLDDRKFFNAIPTPPPANAGGPRFGRTRLRPWTVVGSVRSVSMDAKKPYVGKHSPRIELDASEVRGISQDGVELVDGKAYVGRIVLRGERDSRVAVSLIWGSGPADRQSVELGRLQDGFGTYRFRFAGRPRASTGRFEVEATGSGNLTIGAVSLMPADNLAGFRPEVIKVLKELHSGVYRFPGGNFVSAHEWRNAIGDADQRPPKLDPVWGAVQPNDVGTEEFMQFCKLIDVDPYISVNAGSGDAWSARDYVEYCNGDAKTPMGRLRAKNGHREPYHVKYWGIGNEAWGFSYQFGAMRLAQYVVKHNEFAEAMRSVDPTIQLIGSGAMADTMTGSKESLNLGDSLIPKPLGPADWTGGLFLHCLDNMDLVSEHFYNYGGTHYDLAKGPQVPNDPNEPLVDWMRRPANHVRLKFEEYQDYERLIPGLKAKPVPICMDEWAYAGGPPNSYRVVPAFAWTFHEMFRHSDLYQMACFTFATSMYSANRSDAVLNPAGLLFKLYREHFGSIPVEVTGNSPQPRPTDPPGGEQPSVNAGSDTFPLDVVAAWNDGHTVFSVAVINPTETEKSLDLRIGGVVPSGEGTLWRMAPGSLTAVTDVSGKSEVRVDRSSISGLPTTLRLPKYSVSIFEWRVK